MFQIGVVDCNNFFVSCERLFRPDLLKSPVAVLSSNDGCVVARSQEVKDIGIPMGVPYFKVKDIIKDNKVVLFSSHFALYRDVSRRVFATLDNLLGTIEQYSIDEAFFNVPYDNNPEELAASVKQVIEATVGIPVSVGIGNSKTQAKYAVREAKRTTGVKIIQNDEWLALSAGIKLSTLWGVGDRSFLRYQKAGYETARDLLQADKTRIKTLFGVTGERLMAEISGKSADKVANTKNQAQKSMMSTRSFRQSTEDVTVLKDAVAYHTRHIAKDLRAQNLKTNVVRITIKPSKYSDFVLQGTSLEAVLEAPTNDTFTLLKITQSLLNKAYLPGVPYKKVGVAVGQLISQEMVQEQLFKSNSEQSKILHDLIDGLNTKADRELITVGDRKKGTDWQARCDLISPAYTTKWTDVAKVKA